jgi:hypothetical protein
LKANGVEDEIHAEWAELRHLREVPKGLENRITKAIELYPCDLLFIHRDAEKGSLEERKQEVLEALARIEEPPTSVCVVPIRMQEAWLLFDEAAIRRAAGNPNGRVKLNLPKMQSIEGVPDPKEVLNELLKIASEKTGRRLKRFNASHSASLVSQYIEDFSPLAALSAFDSLNQDVRTTISVLLA